MLLRNNYFIKGDLKMKKILAMLLVIASLFSFAACGIIGGTKVELTRGTLDENVYTNDVLGFTFTKPSSWVYSTDEEIADAMNLGIDLLGKDKFQASLESAASLFDMMAVDRVSGTNLSVGYENLKNTHSSNISVERYIEALEQQLKGVTTMTVEFPDEYDEVTLGEVEFTRVVCTTTMYSVEMQQIYYLHKIDKYMVFITVTIPSSAPYTMADVEDMFG